MREITDSELAAVSGAAPCGYAEFLEFGDCIANCSPLMMNDDGGEAYFLCEVQCHITVGCDG